eukprot:767436-Hanusia_phi.AAC.6
MSSTRYSPSLSDCHTLVLPSLSPPRPALRPLTEKIRSLLLGYLPKLKFPVRKFYHPPPSFSCPDTSTAPSSLSLKDFCRLRRSFADSARAVGDVDLEQAIRSTCMRIFWADENYNSDFEPSAEDFLSPGLCEMDIMRRLLSNEEFVQWATGSYDDIVIMITMMIILEMMMTAMVAMMAIMMEMIHNEDDHNS